MVYSEAVDGIFCIFCALFSSLETPRGSFVSQPFRLWNKKGEKAEQHEKCAYHQSAVDKGTSFRHSIENPESTITAQVYSCKARNIRNNRAVLMSIASAILYCSRQCIALRGDAEDGKSSGNPGNLLALLRLLAQHNEVLRNHLEAPAMRSATHLSPHTQNELIGVMGKHIILKGIVDELNTAKFFAILADEVTSHNVEHLAICARFVDSGKNVREEFLAFIKLERITGEKVAEGILEFLKQNDIPVGNIRGQGYDGASNMAPQRVGVQARIRQEAPLAVYVHCSGHCLNLVISKSCSLPQVRNVMDRLLHCSRFFLYPKRIRILEMIVKHNIIDSANRKPVLDLCQTRWAERHSAFQHFYQSFVFIVEALEMIAYRHHLEKYGDLYADWDPASRSEAQQILSSITSFEFIVVFLIVYQYLSHVAGITVKLQRKSLDIIEAHEMISEVAKVYQTTRTDVDTSFGKIFGQAEMMAKKIRSPVSMPHIASRQAHRSNAEAPSPSEDFKRNIDIPFLDHIIMCIEQRFSQSALIATSLLGLVPSIMCSRDVDVQSAAVTYAADLPSPELLHCEMERWKQRYMNHKPEDRPSSPAKAIKDCDRDCFPNVYILLQIACTIPVTSCECERSASALRRLNNYMRASMGQTRLSNLALLHIHYDTPINLEEVVDIYARLHPRRLELDSLLI